MLNKNWKTLSGASISLRDAIENEMSLYPNSEIHIGSDSQQTDNNTKYVTVCIVNRIGKGGRVFFCRETVPKIRELRERLWHEAWRSTTLAMELSETPDIGTRAPVSIAAIHIDANVDTRHKSSKYVEELVGLVMGQGFKAVVKPDSWAASHAADHAVKHKDERKPKPLKIKGSK